MKNNLLKKGTTIGKWAVLCMIAFCYLTMFLLFYFKHGENHFPRSWMLQFYIILMVSLITTIIAFLLKPRGLILALFFAIELIYKYLLTKPFSNNIWFEFLIIVIILFEGVIFLSIKEIVSLSVTLILTSVFTSHSDIYWGVIVSERTLDTKIALLMLTVLMCSFCIILKSGYILLKRQRDVLLDQNLIIKKLSSANTGFQKYANLAEEKSITSERMRLTRDIHDTVGYTMTNLLMMIEASTDLVGKQPKKLEELLDKALILIKDGHKDMRQSLRVLRNTKVKKGNSIEIVRNLVDVFRNSTGIDVRIELGNLPWVLPDKINNIIYRFLQEGMTNSLTHGEAKNIDIHFRYSDDIIYINLIDDGNGSIDIKEGIGLKGMEERLNEVSGKLLYLSTKSGFSVKVEIPWKDET
ncbi:MAG: histidine kinase [Spirochaetaceae bacterium]